MITKSKKCILIIVGALLIISIGTIGFYFAIFRENDINKNIARRFEIVDTSAPYVIKPTQVTQMFSGKVKKLDRKLDLFDYSVKGDTFSDASEATTNYFEAGEFVSGKYKGYKRIIAVRPDFGYKMESSPFIFATKDYKEFIYDKYENEDRTNMLNSKKVTKKDILDTEAINEIPIDDQFVLAKGPDVMQDQLAIDFETKAGGVQQTVLKTVFDEKDKLKSNYEFLMFYESPSNVRFGGTPNEIHDRYFSRTSQVIVVDSTGVGYRYFVTMKDAIARYKNDLENSRVQSEAELAIGKVESQFRAKGITDKDLMPQYPKKLIRVTPALNFSNEETNIPNQLFNKYTSYNSGCMFPHKSSFIANVQESEITEIGNITKGSIPIFTLKNQQEPVLSNSYGNRFSQGFDFDQLYAPKEQRLEKPSQQEYLNKNPLLFIKDPWGRYILMQEYDYYYSIPCA